ncbi:DUF3331 domain-containing protein [Burkholderia sp. WSM2232]|uniref:DUF3331 domain-containing protein n=1 Tax=Burkholderia sp. WSM2232 TaxID=944436 RepID=UPI000A065249
MSPHQDLPERNGGPTLVNRDPWLAIVYRLKEAALGVRPTIRTIGARRSGGYGVQPARAVSSAFDIVDIARQSDATLLVSWSDPTLGRFVDQRWLIGCARVNGTCRLTGNAVRPGDAVFRPRPRKGIEPPNARDMILVASVRHLFAERALTSRTNDCLDFPCAYRAD